MLRNGTNSGHRSVSFSIRSAVTIVHHMVDEYFPPRPTSLSPVVSSRLYSCLAYEFVLLTFVVGLRLILPISFHSNRPVQAVLLRRSRIISTVITAAVAIVHEIVNIA